MLHKRDQETFEILEKDCSFRDIKFLVCDTCFYKLTGSTVIPEAEVNAENFRKAIEKKSQKKKDREEIDKYLRYIKKMQMKEEGSFPLKETILPNLTYTKLT